VGNRAIHLQQWNDFNAVPANLRLDYAAPLNGDGFAHNIDRPFGAGSFGLINGAQFGGIGNYHALQTLFRTRAKGLDAQFAYTWSHALGDTDFTSAGGANQDNVLLDPFNPGLNYGSTYINRPHIFTGNLVYALPALSGHNAFTRHAIGGWELSTILSYASGNSITVFANGGVNAGAPGGFNGTGGRTDSFRPIRVAGESCRAPSGSAKIQWLNPNGWTLEGYRIGTTSGLTSFGECAGPGLANTDFSVHKNFKITERVNAQFRVDFFNLFNTVQFLGNNNGSQRLNTNLIGTNAGFACTQNYQLNGANFATDCPAGVTNLVGWNNASTRDGGNRNQNFGVVSQDRGPREIQYSIRIEF
jgi:hypothetical protein